MTSVDTNSAGVKSLFSQTVGRVVTAIEDLPGGRNSKVYKLICDNGPSYAVKYYFNHVLDNRDRLQVEFSALEFLWNHGIRCIPQPIFLDKVRGFAIYEFIAGQEISFSAITIKDIDKLAAFLISLKNLKNCPDSLVLPAASEACFSLQEIVGNISFRLEKFRPYRHDGGQYEELNNFLMKDFSPGLAEMINWCQAKARQAGISFMEPVPLGERTLSPSDYGFHNARRRQDGSLVFLDLEYFGWDDPAKMIVDFLLHPAMPLSHDLKCRFVEIIFQGFKEYGRLPKRVALVYPLFGLKWCMIFLNEFIPEHLQRRRFAGQTAPDLAALQARQLSKAQQMLAKIREEYENFPYYP